jgi:hypothetical protein
MCVNQISLSSAQSAITSGKTPTGDYSCKAGEDCLCFDNVTDWETFEIVVDGQGNKVFQENAQKKIDKENAKIAKEVVEKNKKDKVDAIKAKLQTVKKADFKTQSDIVDFLIDLSELLK